MKLLWGLSEKGVHEVLVAIPPHYATWYLFTALLSLKGFLTSIYDLVSRS